MSHPDLRSFINDLESCGELVRIKEEVDPNLEITVIQHKVLKREGPALLFENVKGSPFSMVTNLYGTQKRVNRVFGEDPQVVGERLYSLAEVFMPPEIPKLWNARKMLFRMSSVRMKRVKKGPILFNKNQSPNLSELPILKCWPEDGGNFLTLPLVHTVDPIDGTGNLGIYRMQKFTNNSTGMHWQIEKGGGFHFQKAVDLGQPLPVSVILGGAPALTIAAISPLPEGIDERLLAALIMGKPLEVIKRNSTGHLIPISSEFVLEGSISAGDSQLEGPFGDHLGHYSHSAEFPVFRLNNILMRDKPIYPATVVGKPKQEDYYIGIAIQEMTKPLLKLTNPGVIDLWAYPETGFHPLAVASVKERYPKEALKQAFSILGFSQLSLTKILIVTNGDCKNVRDFKEVSRSIFRHLNEEEGIHLVAPTAQDTLDFTGPSMNTGSRLILLATKKCGSPKRDNVPPPVDRSYSIHRDILDITNVGEAFLVAQVKKSFNSKEVREALKCNDVSKKYMFHILVSEDVPLSDLTHILWGWFTRFDPLVDMYPARKDIEGNRMIFRFPIAIDATWKEGYRKPVEFDPEVVRNVNKKWDSLGLDIK